jgi:TonB family protein
MKSPFLTLSLICILTILKGQSNIDTIYFNSKWQKTSHENCSYFRTITLTKDSLYSIVDYWKSGEKQMEGQLSSLTPETRDGSFFWFYKNGNLKQSMDFKKNNVNGYIKIYNTDGLFYFQYISIIDSLDNAESIRQMIVDLNSFLLSHLKYPKKSKKASIEGELLTHFYIDDKAQLTKFSIIRSLNQELDKAAQDAITSFVNWQIPIYKGHKTYLELTLPIKFTLTD